MELEFEFDQSKFELAKADEKKGVNTYKYVDSGAFKEALKASGIKKADYDAVIHFQKAYGEKAAQALTEFSKKTLLKDKSLQGVIASVPYSRGTIAAAVAREKQGVNTLTGESYRVAGLTLKIKDGTISKSFVKSLKDELTAALIK